MKLRKCIVCSAYTMKEEHCGQKTKQAGHKYIRVKSISEDNKEFKGKI